MVHPKVMQAQTAWVPTLIGGIVIGFVETIFAVSLASLIFSGSLSAELPRGIGIVLITVGLHTILLSFLSSSSGIISSIQDSPAVVIAAATVSIVGASLNAENLAAVLVFIAGAGILTGLVLILLAQFRLGALVRYLPYPVIGGFLAGTGALMLLGGIGVMANVPVALDTLPDLVSPDRLLLWVPGLCFGILMFWGMRSVHHILTFPAFLLAGFVSFYLFLFVSHISIQQAVDAGLLLGNMGDTIRWSPLNLSQLTTINWASLSDQAGNLMVIIIITPITLLLNISGIELAIREDIDINQEMRALGFINILSGLAGGMIGFHALGMTRLSQDMNARNKRIGIVVGVIPLLVLFLGSTILTYIPVPLLGALLVFLGLSFAYEWAIEKRHSLALADWLVVLFIGITIVVAGFLTGIILGLISVVAVFLVNYSRTNIFHHEFSGAETTSNVERNAHQQRELLKLGQHISVMELQGFIFFGTANAILDRLKARLNEAALPLAYMILDFRRVTGVDSSAAFSFIKAQYQAESHNFMLIFTHLSPQLEDQFAHNGIAPNDHLKYFADLDHALEWVENELIEHNRVTQMRVPATLKLQLAERGFAKSHTQRLESYLDVVRLEENDILIHEGAESDDLYFIELGQVTIYVDVPNGAPVRLQTLSLGTLVGEIGFLLRSNRSATVKADCTTIAYRLTRDAMNRLGTEDPELALAVKDLLLGVVAERLATTTRKIAALNR
ncbi:MAG: cyclic nucleotide-binding domain-containing protein [Anaerolineae bacterium]|nr:cyclic nucleotide-binding domain-containing protein [Anaerolineae bacterium]